MRYSLLPIFLFAFIQLSAQKETPVFTESNFEAKILAFGPTQRADVSTKTFDFAAMVLRETVAATKGNAKDFNRADYFNVLTALLSLQEPKEVIDLAFYKFRTSEGSCEYFLEFNDVVEDKGTYLPIIERWHDAALDCKVDAGDAAASTDPTKYALDQNLDPGLVRLIAKVNDRDQQHRKGTYAPEKQTPLDRENEKVIDSLYEHHSCYIGKTLVGDKFETVMWSVIQHSRLPTMEKYLPVMQQAVALAEVPEAPFRMLIDRVYAAKTGKQVFGSQAGVALLSEQERNQIIRIYGINR